MISSLVRKPGAFALYRFRDALFPSLVFRRAYDALAARSTNWADLEYVRILDLSAKTLESRVESVLSEILDRRELPEYELVKAIVGPAEPAAAPHVTVLEPDLAEYDSLLRTACLSEEVA